MSDAAAASVEDAVRFSSACFSSALRGLMPPQRPSRRQCASAARTQNITKNGGSKTSLLAQPEGRPVASTFVFERVLCGIDETPESLEAARQASRLRAPRGSLVLVAVAHTGAAIHAGFSAVPFAAKILAESQAGLGRAAAALPHARPRLVRGRPVAVLLAEIEREEATLVALGSHGRHRVAGLVFGSAATTILHYAPCSVLVARPQRSGDGPPRRIVLGVDGSPDAAAAAAVARELRDRFEAELRVVTGLGGKKLDADLVSERYPAAEFDPRPPMDALVDAAGAADLLVVGSRGLHGWRALGSVSERVAHRAPCSVLVVRGLEKAEARKQD